MEEEFLKKVPLIRLAKMLDRAIEADEQEIVNMLAREVASRIYVPGSRITFAQMMIDFGYKEIVEKQEQEKVKEKVKRK